MDKHNDTFKEKTNRTGISGVALWFLENVCQLIQYKKVSLLLKKIILTMVRVKPTVKQLK